MERRSLKRIPARLEAYIFTGGKTYTGHIDNVSQDGFEYIMTSSADAHTHFQNKKVIEIYFQIPSGEALNLFCQIQWIFKTTLDDRTLTLGMKIMEPSSKFKDFIKTLDIVSVN